MKKFNRRMQFFDIDIVICIQLFNASNRRVKFSKRTHLIILRNDSEYSQNSIENMKMTSERNPASILDASSDEDVIFITLKS